MTVGRYYAQGAPPESGHVRDFVEGMMGLTCQIDRGRRADASKPLFTIVGESPSQCDNDRRKIRLRAAGREGCRGIFRKTKLCRQPGESVPFNFVRRGRGTPSRKLRIVRGHKHIGNDGGKRHARIEKTKITWMGYLDLPGM